MAVEPSSLKRDREHIFHGTQLAESILARLGDPGYKSGLFLSAPRRTGKTTFIKADLLPMSCEAGAVTRAAKLVGLKKVRLGGLEMDLGAIGTQDGDSTSAVQVGLERLRRESLICNAGRGPWFIEDSQHAAWALADVRAPRTMREG